MSSETCDVAIVGAGPVGLTLAALLRQRGIDCRLLERRAHLHRDPQAHVVSARTMEIFRELGVAKAVAIAAAPVAKSRTVSWSQSLTGREFARLSILGGDPRVALEMLSLSPATMVNLAQNRLEPILADRLTALGGAVAFDHEVKAVEQTADHAVLSGAGPDGAPFRLAARYVVACDGAGSPVRRALGVEMLGPTSLARFVTVYFTANLDGYLAGRPGAVHWVTGPVVSAALLGFDLSRTWALMAPYDAPFSLADFTADVAAEMVRHAIGDPGLAFEVTSISSWNMSAQVAERFDAGRVLLAGDAAHRFPPTGGLGMNTGVGDAHNLAWKLDAVLKGAADPALLATYDQERRDAAVMAATQSLDNASRMSELDAALGAALTTPVDPAAVMRPWPTPPDMGVDGDGEAAAAKRAALNKALADQVAHFDPKVAFGGVYAEGCFLPAALGASTSIFAGLIPGARLPHAWLVVRDRRTALHDLCSPKGFTLLTGSGGAAWRDAAAALATDLRTPLRVVHIGPEGGAQDRSGALAALDGWSGDGGAVLVRPDTCIAARWDGPADAPAATLKSTLVALLGAPALAAAPHLAA